MSATGMHQHRSIRRGDLTAALLASLPWLAGCGMLLTLPAPPDSQSLLKAVETGPESLTLEIFQVRIPADERALADQLWSSIDEQGIELASRRDLLRNGFRAGVLGGTLPEALARHFSTQRENPESQTTRLITDQSASPRVVRRVLQLHRNDEATVQASELRNQLHVFVNGDDGLQGHSFEQVQAAYTLRVEASPGQCVAVRLTPELQHGQLRNRYAGSDQGIFLVTPSREREAYDRLMISTELAAGELLVVGCLPDAFGSLGWAFHGVDRDGPGEQKLVLVRLLQVPPSEILADANVLGQ